MTMQMQTDESIGASGSGGQHAAQRSLAVLSSYAPFIRSSVRRRLQSYLYLLFIIIIIIIIRWRRVTL
jgi:hypothetical protein